MQPLLKLQKVKPHWMFTLDNLIRNAVQQALRLLKPAEDPTGAAGLVDAGMPDGDDGSREQQFQWVPPAIRQQQAMAAAHFPQAASPSGFGGGDGSPCKYSEQIKTFGLPFVCIGRSSPPFIQFPFFVQPVRGFDQR